MPRADELSGSSNVLDAPLRRAPRTACPVAGADASSLPGSQRRRCTTLWLMPPTLPMCHCRPPSRSSPRRHLCGRPTSRHHQGSSLASFTCLRTAPSLQLPRTSIRVNTVRSATSQLFIILLLFFMLASKLMSLGLFS
jgi:hypothetical protein